ncbi:hypothetical protein ACFVFQ_28755 [Streptomyces sp. NPDC057743]|uniref:hypothetical protein n=1 Tax=Streptomyces sp. NPDC057743 TaxID=3346236 RepID=UPI00369152AD
MPAQRQRRGPGGPVAVHFALALGVGLGVALGFTLPLPQPVDRVPDALGHDRFPDTGGSG